MWASSSSIAFERGHPDHGEAGRDTGRNPGRRVLEHDHVRARVHAQLAARLEVGIGRRLRRGDLVAADDDVEAPAHVDELERDLDERAR